MGNRLLTYNRKCLYNKHFIDLNILYIKDVLDLNGKIKSTIYEKLKQKHQYFRNMTLINKALGPYIGLLYNKDSVIDIYNNEITVSTLTSKQCYSKLVTQKVTSAKFWVR